VLALALLPAAAALAHGVEATVGHGGAVTVTVRHEGGSPLAFVPCEVLPPGGPPAFQVGRTDRLGRVVFLPDRAGEWTVKITGEDGHGAVVPVVVDAALAAVGAGAPRPAGGGRAWKLMAGVGVLLGVFGIVSLTLQRRR
ncbi:MAG: hypothetical protein ABR506_13325, partial [Candidatus Krumholzibacteriia bacterium]